MRNQSQVFPVDVIKIRKQQLPARCHTIAAAWAGEEWTVLVTMLLKKKMLLKGERSGVLFLEMIGGGGMSGTDDSGRLCLRKGFTLSYCLSCSACWWEGKAGRELCLFGNSSVIGSVSASCPVTDICVQMVPDLSISMSRSTICGVLMSGRAG